MELGEKIGAGAGSEVFAWGDGRALKLMLPGLPRGLAEYEQRVTRAASSAGVRAPVVHDVVEVDGRFGLVMDRHDGKSLLECVIAGEVSAAAAGAIVAELLHGLHAGRHATELMTFRAWVMFSLDRLALAGIASDVLAIAREATLGLPEAGVLCHCDLHPGNVLMTADGPLMIDWTSALNASPMVDIARQHLTFTLLHADPAYDDARREADATLIETYASLSGITPGQLLISVEPYMCVMAVMRMMESSSTDEEKASLSHYVRASSAIA